MESPLPQLIAAENWLAMSLGLGSVNDATVPVNGRPSTAKIGAAVICCSDEFVTLTVLVSVRDAPPWSAMSVLTVNVPAVV